MLSRMFAYVYMCIYMFICMYEVKLVNSETPISFKIIGHPKCGQVFLGKHHFENRYRTGFREPFEPRQHSELSGVMNEAVFNSCLRMWHLATTEQRRCRLCLQPVNGKGKEYTLYSASLYPLI